MANAKYFCTTSAKVNEIPVEVGNLIFCEDTRRIALDGQDGRVFYDQIMCLATDDMRSIMLRNLVDGFYFILETDVLWRLENLVWHQITQNPTAQIVYGSLASFPRPGKVGVIYETDTKLYHWDQDEYTYVDFCSATPQWITEE